MAQLPDYILRALGRKPQVPLMDEYDISPQPGPTRQRGGPNQPPAAPMDYRGDIPKGGLSETIRRKGLVGGAVEATDVLGEAIAEPNTNTLGQALQRGMSRALFGPDYPTARSGEGAPDGTLAEASLEEAALHNPRAVIAGVAAAAENDEDPEKFARSLPMNRPPDEPNLVPGTAMSVQDILNKRTAPEEPDLYTKDDMLKKVLFGIAQGFASRRYWPREMGAVGGAIASMGAGGMAGVIQTDEQNRELRTQYQEDYRQFENEQVALEVELTQMVNNDLLAREKLMMENRLAQDQLSLDWFEAMKPEVQVGLTGITTIRADGKVFYEATPERTAALLAGMVQADTIMAGLSEGLETRRRGVNDQLDLARIPQQLRPAHNAAYFVRELGVMPALIADIEAQVLSDNHELSVALRGGTSGEARQMAQEELDSKVYNLLVVYFLTNPDKLKSAEKMLGKETLNQNLTISPNSFQRGSLFQSMIAR